MKPLFLFRAEHLIPHIAMMRKIGAPIDRELRRAYLPTNIGDRPEMALPLLPALEFLTRINYLEGIEDFELQAVHQLQMENLNKKFLKIAKLAPTLYSALKIFCRFASCETNYATFYMSTDDSNATLYTEFTATTAPICIRHSEWSQIMCFVAVVRAFAGPSWHPEIIGLQSSIPIGKFALEQFPNTRILLGQTISYIHVPRSLFALPPRNKNKQSNRAQLNKPSYKMKTTYPETLKLLLRSYLSEGYPSIKLAATLNDTSVRTLQRQLKQLGVSYSDLVRTAQYESAIELLKDPDIHTLDIAYSVGYQDPSNFSRAFRRISGVSPKEYRALHVAQE